MKILLYNNLNTKKVQKEFKKVISFLEKDNFKSADVKKMPNTGFYRAKLDATNRLLFTFGKYQNETHLLVLEVILNHDYANARFLNGAIMQEENLVAVHNTTDVETQEITFVNSQLSTFYFLDKFLSFDNIQEEALALNAPCIIIGSAGSGKTAITLEKLKSLNGRVLYTTLSQFLSENASILYSSFNYENENQEVDFLSFYEFLCSTKIPKGKEVTFTNFDRWISKYKQSHKIKDTHKLFEEFKGVLTGASFDKAYLSQEDYLSLGVKQSIFLESERASVYDLFLKYLEWLQNENYFDSNIFSYDIQNQIEKKYDYVIVDEVQDITNVQLMAIMKSLLYPTNFILCGDSNQIVHPNFFSWSQIKTMFYHSSEIKGEITKILATNYRNTAEVTQLANQLLMIKNARFGSIDKESTYLVESNSKHKGVVEFLENKPKTTTELNSRTAKSTRFAVLVLRNEDKSQARKIFNTPLLFSIQEAKGLEYENIILYNVISENEKEFRALCDGIDKNELSEESFKFNRNKDKTDKSLDQYKFYINSLYVGITRAVKNLYVIESKKKHELLDLLDLTNFQENTSVENQQSSKEDWLKESARLAKQGKKEQADAINQDILKIHPLPYTPMNVEELRILFDTALNPSNYNKKAKDKLFDYAIINHDVFLLEQLGDLKYNNATKWETQGLSYLKRKYTEYQNDNLKILTPKLDKYGINYRNEQNFTPFMMACYFGSKDICKYLIENGADISAYDLAGRNALQLLVSQIYQHDKEASSIISTVYKNLKTESIKLKINDQLIKIDSHQGEYWLLQYVFATYKIKISKSLSEKDMFIINAQVFVDFFEKLPSSVLLDFRRKRTYISSLLAKNERYKQDKYNKKLFVRVKNGIYLLNPAIEIWNGTGWITQKEWLSIDEYRSLGNNDDDNFRNLVILDGYLKKG